MLKPHCTTRRARHVSMTWWERAAARPRSPSITLQVREKYYGPHHAALRAHDTTVWQRGGHLRQAASRNLGMTATLTKRCQDPTDMLGDMCLCCRGLWSLQNCIMFDENILWSSADMQHNSLTSYLSMLTMIRSRPINIPYMNVKLSACYFR